MKNNRIPKIIGHRGAAGLAPENPFSSLIKAAEMGLTYVEIDVKISKDKIPILLHDDNLKRTAKINGLCSNYTYEELLKFDFGIWFSKKFKNEKILSLAKALDFFYINNIGVNIELKPNKGKEKDNIESITKVIKSKKILPNYFFSSFDTSSLKFVKRNFPNSPRGFLIDNYSFYDKKDIIEICKELKCFCVGIDSNIANKNSINFFKKNKLKVNVYTINNLKFAKKLFLLGVSSIFTDRPDLVKF